MFVSKPEIIIESDPHRLSDIIVHQIAVYFNKRLNNQAFISIALSGGNTPNVLFRKLADISLTLIPWHRVRIFWVDERCVPPEHPESNYGQAKRYFLEHMDLPVNNIYRIHGEDDPESEAHRYSSLISSLVPSKNGVPSLDWILLGVGEDGHVASIFPDQHELMYSNKLCSVAHHPISGQNRITMTGKLINNSSWVSFLATGENKAKIVNDIIHLKNEAEKLPAALIKPRNGRVTWYLDIQAGALLKY